MTNPAPDVLRPSPLDLGSVLSGTFRVLRQRLASFVVLALLPGAVLVVLTIAAIVPLLMGIGATVDRGRFSGLIPLGIVGLSAAVIVGSLAQIKVQAMMVLGAHDTIHREPSTAGELFRRTAGVVGRVLVLVIVVVLAVFVLAGLLIGGFVAVVAAAVASGTGDDQIGVAGAVIGSVLVLMVAMLALGVCAFYLQVRFLYFVPALAVEGRAMTDALKRSWALTRSNVLRTLGYYLVGSLLVGLAASALQGFSQILALPSSINQTAGNDAGTQILALLPALILLGALQLLVQILAVPFLAIYVTVMFVDQIRRNQLLGLTGHPQAGYHPRPGHPVAANQLRGPASPAYPAYPHQGQPAAPSQRGYAAYPGYSGQQPPPGQPASEPRPSGPPGDPDAPRPAQSTPPPGDPAGFR